MSIADSAVSNPYADLEIRIFPRQGEGYPVELTLDGQQRFKRGYLAADVLPWQPSADLDKDGQRLFDTLFADRALYSAWVEARGRSLRRRIRLWIDVNATELHSLPWELLREGPAMLSAQADTPFSRYLPIGLPWGGPVQERPIRVLVVIPAPDDLETKWDLALVDAVSERHNLESAFADVGRSIVRADFLEAPVTSGRLERALREGYHALHFLGHGAFNPRSEQAALFIQDEAGHAHLLRDHQLVSMLAGQSVQPRLIFLAACQSASRSMADALMGLGPKLVTLGVPAVVAMQEKVTVETARQFSATFYRQLFEHGLVDLATNEARSTPLAEGHPDAGVPVLFMRVSNGRLFAPLPSGKTEKARPAGGTLPPGFDPDKVDQIKLRQAMIAAYDKPSLIALCSDLAFAYDDLSVEYDNLRGEAVPSKVLELIQWHRRRRRVGDLVRKVLADFPHLAEELV
jgi:hypothetical protein